MAPEASIMIRFLQLIVLSFTALIYIGQSFLNSDLVDSGQSRNPVISQIAMLQSVKLLGFGAVFMALSGVFVSIYLIPLLSFRPVTILNLLLVDVPLLSPWGTPPALLWIIFTFILTFFYSGKIPIDGYWFDLALIISLFMWIYSGMSSVIAHFEWIPFFGVSLFALGMSLFLVGLLRLGAGVTDKQVTS